MIDPGAKNNISCLTSETKTEISATAEVVDINKCLWFPNGRMYQNKHQVSPLILFAFHVVRMMSE